MSLPIKYPPPLVGRGRGRGTLSEVSFLRYPLSLTLPHKGGGNYLYLLLFALLLNGCDWIGRQADALGEHMPVIGERCEHWQCITSSGQAQSDAYKAQQERQRQATAAAAAGTHPQPTQQPAATGYNYPPQNTPAQPVQGTPLNTAPPQ